MSDQQTLPLPQMELEAKFRLQNVAKKISKKLPNEIRTEILRRLQFIHFADSVSPNDPRYKVQFECACRSNRLIQKNGNDTSWGAQFQEFLSWLPQIPLKCLLERSMNNDVRVPGKTVFIDQLGEHADTIFEGGVNDVSEDHGLRFRMTRLNGHWRIRLCDPLVSEDLGVLSQDSEDTSRVVTEIYEQSPIRQLAFDSANRVYYEMDRRFYRKGLVSRGLNSSYVVNPLSREIFGFVVSNNKLFEVTKNKIVVCYDLDESHASTFRDKEICQSPSLYAYEDSLVVFDPNRSFFVYQSEPRLLKRTAAFHCQNRQLSPSTFLLLLDQGDGYALLKTFTITENTPVQHIVQRCTADAIFGRYNDYIFFVLDEKKRNIFYFVSSQEPPLLIYAGPDLS